MGDGLDPVRTKGLGFIYGPGRKIPFLLGST